MIYSRIVGTGSYLPPRVVTNEDLAKKLDTSDSWIQERTGIRQRHIADESQGSSDLALEASRRALEAAGCTAANLVKLTVFLTDMDHLARYREARNRFFASVTPPAAPAVTLVEVSKLYGPEFMIEIEAIAAA